MSRPKRFRRGWWLLSWFSLGCATLATEAGDSDAPRPNALAGPFRALRAEEIDNFDAPYVLKKKLADFREASVISLEEDGSLGQSVAYVVALLASKPGVYRFVASDGRSFDETPSPSDPVLEVSEAWEGAWVDAPEIARVGNELWLFYSAEGGIGVARSSDGIQFQKQSAPLLDTSSAPAWEAGQAPRAPSFVEVSQGDYRLFYEAAGRIGEAKSDDGTTWQRLGEPVLEPASVGNPSDPPFDAVAVGDPEAWQTQSAEGRSITRVYYRGEAADGQTAIGMAARFTDGKLLRAAAPAFTGPRFPRAPSLSPHQGLTLLFVTEQASANETWPAVAVALAPGNLSIPVK